LQLLFEHGPELSAHEAPTENRGEEKGENSVRKPQAAETEKERKAMKLSLTGIGTASRTNHFRLNRLQVLHIRFH
jgi:hypothetical protein